MPVTYNGIGTRYHGQTNVQTRTGVCRSCGRTVQLQSYDTRLWFVILYIPIIPLGRKHIIDSCPACRRHYATDLDKWETARQLDRLGLVIPAPDERDPEVTLVALDRLDEGRSTLHLIPEGFEGTRSVGLQCLRECGESRAVDVGAWPDGLPSGDGRGVDRQ